MFTYRTSLCIDVHNNIICCYYLGIPNSLQNVKFKFNVTIGHIDHNIDSWYILILTYKYIITGFFRTYRNTNQQEPCHRYQKINGNFSVLGRLWKKLSVVHTGLTCCKGKVLHIYIIIIIYYSIILLLYCIILSCRVHGRFSFDKSHALIPLNRTWKGTRLAQIAFIYITLALLFSKREYVIITVQCARILAECCVKPINVDHNIYLYYYIMYLCSITLDSELCSHVTAELYRRFRIPIHISWNISNVLRYYAHTLKTINFFTNILVTKNIYNWV